MMPCAPWVDLYGGDELCAPCAGIYDLDDALMEEKILAASQVLYQMSGQQFTGLCSDTFRICSAPTQLSLGMMERDTFLYGYYNRCGCRIDVLCTCDELQSISLLDFTQSVDGFTINGDIVDPASYELRGNRLVRLSGDPWPCCGDIQVELTYGVEPPLIGKTAAAVLACELYLACNSGSSGSKECRLPPRVASIARQGVSVIFQSLTTPGQAMRFGIWEIDTFLEAFNPYGNHARSTVLSPDVDEDLERVP